ncbi:MAG TPA: hypothetical protein VKU77_01275 [Streptosporangiaceae bacterium]|nr:hypothetical protein [Streptosporangiaceae bacterium]
MSSNVQAGGSNGPLSAGGLFSPAAVQASAYTASPGDFVPVDTTSGAVTVTLPTAPADGTSISVRMVKQGGSNAVTVSCGGADVIDLPGGSASVTLAALYQGVILQYKAALGVWYRFDLPGQISGASFQSAFAPKVVALTDGATIATNAALGNDFRVTLGGNRTMGAPSNPADGQKITYQLTQDATGSRTVTWNAAFDFGTSGAPTLTLTAAKTDLIRFVYNATAAKWFYDGSQLGM